MIKHGIFIHTYSLLNYIFLNDWLSLFRESTPATSSGNRYLLHRLIIKIQEQLSGKPDDVQDVDSNYLTNVYIFQSPESSILLLQCTRDEVGNDVCIKQF